MSGPYTRSNSSDCLKSESDVSNEKHFEQLKKDEPDAIPKDTSFRWYDVCIMLYSIVSYVADTGLDIAVAHGLYTDNKMWYFGLTVAFIVIPTLIMTFFSLRWYISDSKVPGSPKPTPAIWAMRIILLLLQLGPALRLYITLHFNQLSPKILASSTKNKKILLLVAMNWN